MFRVGSNTPNKRKKVSKQSVIFELRFISRTLVTYRRRVVLTSSRKGIVTVDILTYNEMSRILHLSQVIVSGKSAGLARLESFDLCFPDFR